MSRVFRRHFLVAGVAVGASCALRGALASLLPGGRGRRVVVVGAGWGGLSAARHLRQLAPELDVVLLDAEAAFRSLAFSNPWLVGLDAGPAPPADIGAVAKALGYTFIRARVTAIDRELRRVVTANGVLDYDWLVLALGIGHDYTPWFGDDARAVAQARETCPAGFVAAELDPLRRVIEGFNGGTFLMTVPPAPYRCPPAPYERAMMMASLFKKKRIKGQVLIIDPGAGMGAFNRVFAERYRDQIVHMTHAVVKSVDPFRKTLATEVEDIRYDQAMLAPPQQAGGLIGQAGLVARDDAGRSSGWGAIDPLHLHARDDERVFMVGDMIGRVSPLFGHYPKSGHLASRLGRIAAAEIAARARGREPGISLPDSVCHVFSDVQPMERIQINASYRLRGDGLIEQTVRQHHDPQPRNEAADWARAMHAELLGAD